jgi:hypothetical protein
MPLDRSRFLLLTAALAAGVGCDSLKSRANEAAPDPLGKSSPAQGTPDPPPAETAATVGNPKPSPGAHPKVTAAVAPGHPAAEGGAVAPAAEGTGPAAEGTVAAVSNVSGGGWNTCDDSVGSPADCNLLRPPTPIAAAAAGWPPHPPGWHPPAGVAPAQHVAPQCEGFMAVRHSCDRFRNGLRPKIAERAVGCMLAASGQKAACDFDTPTNCLNAAISSACVEPASAAKCDDIANQCAWHPPGVSACRQLLSALQPNERASAIACMTEGCDAHACGPQ